MMKSNLAKDYLGNLSKEEERARIKAEKLKYKHQKNHATTKPYMPSASER